MFEDNEHRVRDVRPGHTAFSLVLGKKLVERSAFTQLSDARLLQEKGATAMFRLLHHYHPQVRATCQELANDIGIRMHAVGYWTPPNSQGFPLHADMDSVIALQTVGSKTWAFFPPKVTRADDPNLFWIASGTEQETTPPIEQAHSVLTVEAGQTLFVPRGWGHYAIAGESDSVHVSFGILHPEIDADKAEQQYPVFPLI